MASNISEIKLTNGAAKNWFDKVNWLYPTLALAIFLCFFKLGASPVEGQNEIHTGIHAIEMLQTGKFLSLQPGVASQAVTSRPPLVVWMAATSFHLFGYNAFSLRLHAAIAGVFIFFFLFRIVHLYRPPLFAFGLCLMLFSVQGVIGLQITRNGGADAVFIAFLFAGLFYFLRYIDFMRYHDVYKAALLWGLAFFAKGPAFGIFIPGLLLYLALDGRLLHVLRLREVYKAIGLLLLFPLTWYLSLYFFGLPVGDPVFEGSAVLERLFVDRSGRNQSGQTPPTADPLFLWHALRENFRHWDLVFYAVLLGGIVRKLITGLPKWEPLRYRFTILSICIWLPLAVLLSVVTYSAYWFFAPALPFVAATAMSGIWWLYRQYPRGVVGSFLIFWLFCMYYRYLSHPPRSAPDGIYTQLVHRQNEMLADEAKIYQVGKLPTQSVLLDLYFANPNVLYGSVEQVLADPESNISVFIRREEWKKQQGRFVDYALVDEDEFYLILEKN